jgi:MFS family permease
METEWPLHRGNRNGQRDSYGCGQDGISVLRLQLAYVLGQLPSGGLLDRFGSKRVYGISISIWSVCSFLTGLAGYLGASVAFTVIFALRLISGTAQAPVFPGNGRIVASWFPSAERGRFRHIQLVAIFCLRSPEAVFWIVTRQCCKAGSRHS